MWQHLDGTSLLIGIGLGYFCCLVTIFVVYRSK